MLSGNQHPVFTGKEDAAQVDDDVGTRDRVELNARVEPRNAVIKEIEFAKGPDSTAPIIMAVTVEAPE